ncbi:hypothetical protein [Herbidospora cretacea]|uniref:hypothetical protein n=1 Tax=Herbidospora cretacea TaxID=28444 RepID=UPI0007731B2C|nr:hypothetical protein [Herbidospora cretacea]
MVVPALAMADAATANRGDDAADLLAGMDLLDAVTVAPLSGPRQILALASMITRTGLPHGDAHVAAIADVAVCPILTLDAAHWRDPSAALDEPLHIREIRDPGE